MNEFSLGAAAWLWDYYLLASALLLVALVATSFIRQPVRRRAIAWSAVAALFALAVLCAWPDWAQVHIVPPAAAQPAWTEDLQPIVGPIIQQVELPAIGPAEAPVVAATEITTIDIGVLSIYVFLIGSACVATWLVLGAWQVRRICASAAVPPGHIVELFQRLAPTVRALPRLGVARDLHVPVAVGLWRPMILLPASLAERAPAAELRTVLAHELAHVRHRDLWLLAALRTLLVVLWAHPLFWLLRRRVRLDQELLADAAAAETSDPHGYAEQLVRLARASVAVRRPRLASSVGLWEDPSQLKRRLAVLLDEKLTLLRSCSRRWQFGAALVPATIAIALSLVTLEPVKELVAQEADVEASATAADANRPQQFSSGAKVTLLAIGTNGEQPVRWWTPDGKPLDSPPFQVTWNDNISPVPNRQLVFAVEGAAEDADLRRRTLPASSASSNEVTPDDPAEGTKYYSHVFNLKPEQQTFQLQVGIADSQWRTVVSGLNSSHGLPEKKSAIFSQPLIDPQGNVLVIVSHNFHESDSRVVGVDKKGERHIAEPSGAYGAGPLNQSYWRFPGLLPSDLKTCKLQTRPYEWVEFKDLPASPLQRAVRKEAELPWSVHGRITDADGNGLVDVEVRAATGYGTLVGGGSTKTDRDGRYRLAFGPGMAMKRSEEAPLGVGVQAASIFAGKPGWFEANLCRQGNLLMTDLTPETIDNEHKRWGHKTLETVVFPDQPKDVNFVMKPAAVIEGVLYEQGKGVVVADQAISVVGEQLPPSSSELMNVFTGRDGRFLIADLPTEFEWKFAIRIPNSILQLKTEPIRFNEPGKYRCRLILESSSGEDKGVAIRLRIAKMERADEPESGTPPIDHIFQPETPTVRRR
jgi:beta-lactamase regulating signal transducer with metallopeptidase domain